MNLLSRIHYSLLLTLQGMFEPPWWQHAVEVAAPYAPWIPLWLLAFGYLAGIVRKPLPGLLVNVVCPALAVLGAVVAAVSGYRLSLPEPPAFDAVVFALSALMFPVALGIPVGSFVRRRRVLLIITSFLLVATAIAWTAAVVSGDVTWSLDKPWPHELRRHSK